jgi:hypothetical protein
VNDVTRGLTGRVRAEIDRWLGKPERI